MKCHALLAAALAPLAFAHVTLESPTAPANSLYKAVLRIGHGCEGSATTGLRVLLPEGVTDAKPMPKAAWQIKTETGKPPVMADGKAGKAVVTAISWSGGTLPDDFYDEFAFRVKLPDTPGKTLWFKVEQRCERGSTDWTAIPAEGQDGHSLEHPAAELKLLPATGHSH